MVSVSRAEAQRHQLTVHCRGKQNKERRTPPPDSLCCVSSMLLGDAWLSSAGALLSPHRRFASSWRPQRVSTMEHDETQQATRRRTRDAVHSRCIQAGVAVARGVASSTSGNSVLHTLLRPSVAAFQIPLLQRL